MVPFDGFIQVGQRSRSCGLDKLSSGNPLVCGNCPKSGSSLVCENSPKSESSLVVENYLKSLILRLICGKGSLIRILASFGNYMYL